MTAEAQRTKRPPLIIQYTEQEAAELLEISPLALKNERRLGRISFQRRGKRGVRYREEHLREYLDKKQVLACPKEETPNDSSSASSGSASESTRPSGALLGSTKRRDRLNAVRQAREILSGRKSH
jgi:hypothetical protein